MAGWDEAQGRAKEALGDLTDDKDMEREGKLDKLSGDVKDKVDDVKDAVQDRFDDDDVRQ